MIIFNLADYHYSLKGGPPPFKESDYLKGYIAAGVELALIIRLADMKFRLFYAFIGPLLRILLSCLSKQHQDKNVHIMIIQNCWIFIWFGYVLYTTERSERNLFLKYWDNKEQLKKFKQLITEHLSQSIVIFQANIERRLYSNHAYSKLFSPQFELNFSPNHTSLNLDNNNNNNKNNNGSLTLDNIKVETKTVRELGGRDSLTVFNTDSVSFKEFVRQVIKTELLHDKPVVLSASHAFKDQKRFFDITICRLKWEQEDAIAVILHDTTYREKATQLKLANEHKDKTIATISHELRTPLGGIIGILEACENKVSPEVGEYLELCHSNAHLLMGLVNSLLDMSQIRQGKLLLNSQKCDIRRVLGSIVQLFQFQCKKKDISLDLQVDEEVAKHVYTDEARFKQILINLVGNAIKFTTKGGITIKATQSKDLKGYLDIYVEDTGVGIAEEDLPKLFKAYGKLADEEGMNHQGVGLGLKISETLAGLLSNKQNGHLHPISVSSQKGIGTKFSFEILKDLREVVKRQNKSPSDLNDDNQEQAKEDEELAISEENVTTSECFDQEIIPQYLDSRANNSYYMPSWGGHAFDSPPRGDRNRDIDRDSSRDGLVTPDSSRFSTFRFDKSTWTYTPKSSFMPKHIVSPTPPATFHRRSTRRGYTALARLQKNKGYVLAVDDNPFNLVAAKNIMTQLDHNLKTAKSGIEAIEMIKSAEDGFKSFKAILMDCEMPIMDGFEATKILNEMMVAQDAEKVPIIALSANNGDDEIKKCYEYGMVAFLPKPLSAVKLQRVFDDLNIDFSD